MLQLKQVGGVQVSPDGKQVAFVVRRAVMDGEKSEFVSQIHVANADGTGEFPLTQGETSSDGSAVVARRRDRSLSSPSGRARPRSG